VSSLRRQILQAVALFCCITFVIAQVSLILWCQLSIGLATYSAIMLAIDTANTLPIMILAVPFIPTPRHLLLAILLILGTFVLITGVVARASILLHPTHSSYLNLYTTESTLSIIFANLPFLTSLVVTVAPRLSPHLSLSQWPRSRQASWVGYATTPPLRRTRYDSVASTTMIVGSSRDVEKGLGHNIHCTNDMASAPNAKEHWTAISDESASSHDGLRSEHDPTLPSAAAMRPETNDSQVPKMRLSGGLAEMGELSLQDTTQGWPICWR
jgi:hypothetical protein